MQKNKQQNQTKPKKSTGKRVTRVKHNKAHPTRGAGGETREGLTQEDLKSWDHQWKKDDTERHSTKEGSVGAGQERQHGRIRPTERRTKKHVQGEANERGKANKKDNPTTERRSKRKGGKRGTAPDREGAWAKERNSGRKANDAAAITEERPGQSRMGKDKEPTGARRAGKGPRKKSEHTSEDHGRERCRPRKRRDKESGRERRNQAQEKVGEIAGDNQLLHHPKNKGHENNKRGHEPGRKPKNGGRRPTTEKQGRARPRATHVTKQREKKHNDPGTPRRKNPGEPDKRKKRQTGPKERG